MLSSCQCFGVVMLSSFASASLAFKSVTNSTLTVQHRAAHDCSCPASCHLPHPVCSFTDCCCSCCSSLCSAIAYNCDLGEPAVAAGTGARVHSSNRDRHEERLAGHGPCLALQLCVLQLQLCVHAHLCSVSHRHTHSSCATA